MPSCPRLCCYYITDRLAAGGAEALLRFVRRGLLEGASIQVREKDLSARNCAAWCEYSAASKPYGTRACW
jgi:thiamine monophosphate synthase